MRRKRYYVKLLKETEVYEYFYTSQAADARAEGARTAPFFATRVYAHELTTKQRRTARRGCGYSHLGHCEN